MSLKQFNSFKNKQNRKLLASLNRAILILKLYKQNNETVLPDNSIPESREFIISFLAKLFENIDLILNQENLSNVDLDYATIARQYIHTVNDITSDLQNMQELLNHIKNQNEFENDDFQYLDRLQNLLEKDVDTSIKQLYRK